MNSDTGRINLRWAYFTANLLARSGIRHICLSPGSRNTPLTAAFTETPGLTCTSHLDERSAGYFALGVAKASGHPAALCCTSGTAAANYLPAVVEANYSRVPLIVITADRPAKRVGSGANQTIHQKNLYGVHVRYFRDVGEPENRTIDLNQFLVSAISMALGINAKGEFVNPPGPVHLNFPFDEPLIPAQYERTGPADMITPKLTVPPVTYVDSLPEPRLCELSNRPLIVCGRVPDASDREAVLQLSEQLNAPVFADAASHLRFGNVHPNVICHYDLFLRERDIQPDRVIRFGAKPVSKILCNKLDEWKDISTLVDPTGRYNDDCPEVIPCRISVFTRAVLTAGGSKRNSDEWLQGIRDLEMKTNETIRIFMENNPLFEGSAVLTCIRNLRGDDHLFLGNSMPVRDAEAFSGRMSADVRVFVNRGASGIDGCTSTASGAAFHTSRSGDHLYSQNRTFLISGDLSFLYDLSALQAARRYGVNLTVVVINNGGGGIFSFLPVAEYGITDFEKYWTTPGNVSVKKIAGLFDCAYFSAHSIREITETIDKSRRVNGPAVIEVRTRIADNVDAHRRLYESVRQALAEE